MSVKSEIAALLKRVTTVEDKLPQKKEDTLPQTIEAARVTVDFEYYLKENPRRNYSTAGWGLAGCRDLELQAYYNKPVKVTRQVNVEEVLTLVLEYLDCDVVLADDDQGSEELLLVDRE